MRSAPTSPSLPPVSGAPKLADLVIIAMLLAGVVVMARLWLLA